MENEYRITAQIKTKSGRVKNVRISATRETLEKKLVQYFGAYQYRVLQFGAVRFSSYQPWTKIRKGVTNAE